MLESLNLALFEALNAIAGPPSVVAALEALAQAPVWLLPPFVAGVWLLGQRASRETAVMAGVAACVAMAMAHGASSLIDHPRPFMLGLAPNLLNHPDDSSFPSDHTTLFFALAVAFGLRRSHDRRGLAWGLAGLGLAVGLARVALGVHFPLDIVGAIAIGSAGGLIAVFLLRLLATILFHGGEHVRRRIGLLAARDDREFVG